MPVDYETIMATNFRSLKDAAEEWKTMSKKFSKLHTSYHRNISKHLEGAWQGYASVEFSVHSRHTQEEYKQAAAEAKAVAGLLSEAHSTFSSLKKRLESVVKDAREAGMRVDQGGTCSVDESKLSEEEKRSYRNDPNSEDTARSWTEKIGKVVKEVQEADDDFKRALTAKDRSDKGLKDGFNGTLRENLGEYRADQAIPLAEKIGDGDASEKDIRKFAALAKENSDNRDFSQTLLQSVGPEGLINVTNELNSGEYSEEASKKQRLRIQNDLSGILATATKVPQFKDENGKTVKIGSSEYGRQLKEWQESKDGRFYKQWRAEMQEVGGKTYRASDNDDSKGSVLPPGKSTAMRGYQVITDLMGRDDSYSPQYLSDMADDIRDFEESEGDYAWDPAAENNKNLEGTGVVEDPYDSVLGMMADQPEAAAAYLDPGTDPDPTDGTRKNDRLEYLVNRDWPDLHKGDQKEGFESALLAGATGRPSDSNGNDTPSVHSSANAGVMEETVRIFGSDSSLIEKDGDWESSRTTLGKMAADYPGDIQRPMFERGERSGSFDIPVSGEAADFKTTNLKPFLEEVARDPEANGAITTSQNVYTANYLQDVLNDPSKQDPEIARQTVDSGARVSGILAGARAEGMYEEEMDKQDEYNDKLEEGNKWAGRFAGLGLGVMESHPVGAAVAGPAEWVVEDLSESIVGNMKMDNEDAAEGASEQYELKKRKHQIQLMSDATEKACLEAGIDERERQRIVGAVENEVGNSFDIRMGGLEGRS